MKRLHFSRQALRKSCLVSAYPLVPPWPILSGGRGTRSISIGQSTENSTENATKLSANSLIKNTTASKTQYTKNFGSGKRFRSPALRLMDYVNWGDLEVNMAKQVPNWKKFSYRDDQIPEELRESFLLDASKKQSSVDTLEVLTLFGIILMRYRKGQVDEPYIKNFVYRMCNQVPELREIPRGFWKVMEDVEKLSLEAEPESETERERDHDRETSTILKILASKGYSKQTYLKWINCVLAKRCIEAFQAMNNVPYDTWPAFLVLFTLRRQYSCRLSVHKSIQLFQYSFPHLDRYWQVAAYIRALRPAQEWLIEYVPVLSKIYVLHADDFNRTGFHFNQMLWLISKFGTNWTTDQAKSLLESQRIIVDEMKRLDISVDTKGYLALAHVAKDLYPEHSRNIVELVKAHGYEYSHEELAVLNSSENRSRDSNGGGVLGRFPYEQGVHAMEILLAQDYTEALRVLQRIPIEKRTATLWGLLISRTYGLRQLTPFITEAFWQKIKQDQVELNPFLMSKLLDGFRLVSSSSNSNSSNSSRSKVKELYEYASGSGSKKIRIKFSILEKHLKIRSEQELGEMRALLANVERVSIGAYEKLMLAERLHDPGALWMTYERLRADGYDPSVRILQTLCMAAADVSLKWGELYATQRTVVEFKTWIRGSNLLDSTDATDPLKLYPSDRLFYHYIIMLANAGYRELLIDVLPWMARIRFRPSKLTLCAIIVNAPNAEFLKKHASKIQGDWPTEEELENYQLYNNPKR